jgi:ankyrin repeat protein
LIGSFSHLAAVNNRKAVLEALIIHGCDLNCKEDDGETPIEVAEEKETKEWILEVVAREGKHDDIKALLKLAKLDINFRSKNNVTMLMAAAKKGRKDAVKTLIKLGADVKKTNKDGTYRIVYILLTQGLQR